MKINCFKSYIKDVNDRNHSYLSTLNSKLLDYGIPQSFSYLWHAPWIPKHKRKEAIDIRHIYPFGRYFWSSFRSTILDDLNLRSCKLASVLFLSLSKRSLKRSGSIASCTDEGMECKPCFLRASSVPIYRSSSILESF